jgi:hypothetical protein
MLTILMNTAEPFPTNDPLFNVTFDPNFTFGSEAANLEYSILSAILGNPSPPDSASAAAPSPQQPQNLPNSAWSPEPLHAQPHYSQGGTTNTYGFGAQSLSIPQSETSLVTAAQASPTTTFITNYSPTSLSQARPSQEPTPDLQYPPQFSHGHPPTTTAPSHTIPPRYSRDVSSSAPTGVVRAPLKEAGPQSVVSSTYASPSPTNSHPSSMDHHSVRHTCLHPFVNANSAREQTLNVTVPYDYTEGYHFLMKHLPTRYVHPRVET